MQPHTMRDTAEHKLEELSRKIDAWLEARKSEMDARDAEKDFRAMRKEIEDSLKGEVEESKDAVKEGWQDFRLKIMDGLDKLQNRAQVLWDK